MFTYLVYGVKLQSNLEIPALPLWAEGADYHGEATLNYDSTPADFAEYHPDAQIYCSLENGVIFDRRVCMFKLKDGRDITVQPSENLNMRQIQLYILGTLLMIMLYQQGVLVLHGSAVEIDGQIVGVIAPSGTGKSTTAAALFKKGYRLLSDDAVPLVWRDGQFYVYPGYPRLKISEKVTEALDYSAEKVLERHPECQEISFDAKGQFADEPLPLKQIYVLEAGEEIGIAPMSTRDALFAMMNNSLPTMWLKSHSPAQFKQATEFVKAVPFYRMTRSSNIADLPRFATMLEEHFLERHLDAGEVSHEVSPAVPALTC
jgi:hypothetical protein